MTLPRSVLIAFVLWYLPGALDYLPLPATDAGILFVYYCGSLAQTVSFALIAYLSTKKRDDNGDAWRRFFLYLMPLILLLTIVQQAASVIALMAGYIWEPQAGYSIYDSIIIGTAVAGAILKAQRPRRYKESRMGFR